MSTAVSENISKQFKKYNHALIPSVPPHLLEIPSKQDIRHLVWKSKVLFARYTSDFQLIIPPDCNIESSDIQPDTMSENTIPQVWYFCIREMPISLESLTAKQRYRVKKGLKKNNIRKIDWNDIESRFDEFFDMLVASFSDFPDVYRPTLDKENIRNNLKSACQSDNIDVWLCEEVETGKIIGYSWCSLVQNMVNLNVVKIDPAYLKNEVNAALGFVLCQYYLNEKKLKYICDGERNIRHQSNYQNFLVSVLGFRKAYCRLHIVYNPLVAPFVSLLYPLRNFLVRFKESNSLIYNIYCLLMQEQYARESQKDS